MGFSNYTAKEPVKHTSCKGCVNGKNEDCFPRQCTGRCQGCSHDQRTIMSLNTSPRRNWTPKEPEPAAPVDCENILCKDCPLPKEPKAEPGLIGCKIIGGKGNELWIVDMPWGNSIALYKAVGRKDFDHIETKLGAQYGIKVIALRAFDSNDPPVRAWFRQ